MRKGATRLRRALPMVLVALSMALTGCSAAQEAVNNIGKSDTGRSKVGDCINVIEGSIVDSKTEPVDCASPKAVYKVAKVYGAKTECAADYTSYEETMKGMTRAFLCLAPNFQQGSCYKDNMLTGYTFAECTPSKASFRVVSRIDGQSDENLCGSDADSAITVPDPKVTFCTQKL
ncbi:LppU/SCO3897 family protein [Nocardia panacis]|uniref:LppU/SCO3897 family protein n=1 Tax=Nocardia panacis TaxID=2340916 RepID=UPI0013154F07|nr:hypothetical protein [Nocardia panacis]